MIFVNNQCKISFINKGKEAQENEDGEVDSGTDSPGRDLALKGDDAELDIELTPQEDRIYARSSKLIVADVCLRKRAYYRFQISYELSKFLCMQRE